MVCMDSYPAALQKQSCQPRHTVCYIMSFQPTAACNNPPQNCMARTYARTFILARPDSLLVGVHAYKLDIIGAYICITSNLYALAWRESGHAKLHINCIVFNLVYY